MRFDREATYIKNNLSLTVTDMARHAELSSFLADAPVTARFIHASPVHTWVG